MLEHLPPRTFVDFTVPLRSDGSRMTSCQGKKEYQHYLRWLSDHLHTAELPLSADERTWLQNRPDPEGVIFQCSDAFGYAIDELEGLQLRFAEGKNYEEYCKEMHVFYLELLTNEDLIEETFEEWLDLTKTTFTRLHREWEQERQTGQSWSHADIPFRPLLNWALRQIPDADKRFKELDHYFQNFQDNASK